MEISWLGHSCFRIKGATATVVTDPYSRELGYSLGQPEADIVTVSHAHAGHSYTQGIASGPRIVSGPGEYEISGILIIGVTTFHDNEKGIKRGKNTVYVMDVDEVSICHLGDLGHALTPEQLGDIDKVDVLLLPVGGVSTLDATSAAEVVRQLEPRIIVPMHYKTEALKRDELETVDRFLKEMGVKEAVPKPKLAVTKSNLPLGTQVHLLSY
ncbi:MAG: MBL fold metallo-hydrolase [Chloroflexi bacterium]|nr:MBL fold metallo-hydrolase [Chloroflexota bacterium]